MNKVRLVIKKNESIVEYDFNKIRNAVMKAAERANVKLYGEFWESFKEKVESYLDSFPTTLRSAGDDVVMTYTVHDLHVLVEQALKDVAPDVYRSYSQYRDYKTTFVKTMDELFKKTQATLYLGDRENANFDSTLASTKGSLIRGYLTKELYKQFILSKSELQAIEDGYIYIHDLRDLMFNTINCCLFDMETVLKGGFTMSSIEYVEPKSVLSALQVIGDITLSATAQQFGGFTIPEIDKTLIPYVKRSYKNHMDDMVKYQIPLSHSTYAWDKVKEELKQGFQSLEMKLNTVPCSRGDYAFTTLSFGNMDLTNPEDNFIQKMICEAILDVRMQGQGKKAKPVVFPKLVYLHSKKNHEKNELQREVFEKAIECNTKAMYPDYLDIDQHGAVADAYNRSGKVISPMGCRAYLSPAYDDNGEEFYVGRANIGAVSLNLPMIWMKAKEEGKDFFEVLEHYLEMIRQIHIKRYQTLAETPVSTNPLAFTQGGLYKGFKDPSDVIGDEIVRKFTASFGITALNELHQLVFDKPLHEGNDDFISVVLEFIEKKLAAYKEEDGYLYAMYGTPAESLCGTQLQQFREKYGVIKGVSDKEYFTNSFHMHVGAELTPFEKQDKEFSFFHHCNGGHIQYIRLPNKNNAKAIKAMVERGMGKGFYQGINFDLAICENCGHRPDGDVENCPECGSHDISVINRVCGYLSFSKLKGDTRMNASKMAEIRDRVSM